MTHPNTRKQQPEHKKRKSQFPGRKLGAFARVSISPEAETKLRRMMGKRYKYNTLLNR